MNGRQYIRRRGSLTSTKRQGGIGTYTHFKIFVEKQGIQIPMYLNAQEKLHLEKKYSQHVFVKPNDDDVLLTGVINSAIHKINEDRISGNKSTLKGILNKYNLELKKVKGDGNCFFRAVSDQMKGGETYHTEYRKLLCEHIKIHKTKFVHDLEVLGYDEETIADILKLDICNDTEWVQTDFHVDLMSQLIKKQIRLISISLEHGVHETYHGKQSNGIITLIYEQNVHYNSTQQGQADLEKIYEILSK